MPPITSGQVEDGAILEVDLNSDVKLSRAQLAMDVTSPPTAAAGRGVVLGTGAEGAVSPLAAPGMAVRIVTGGTAISHRGIKAAIPTIDPLAISAADGVNPRWDVVVMPDGGTIPVVREGAAAGAPADPVLTAGDVPLCRVVVPATAAAINVGAGTDGWCVDLRARQAAFVPMPAQSCGLPNGSTDISAAGVNADLRVIVGGGGGAVALTIPDPGAFSIGGAAAVALNSAARIVAALNQLAAQAAQACRFSYDLTSLRYYCTTDQLGGLAVITVLPGLVNNIADDLLLGAAAGGEERGGTDLLSTAYVRAAAHPSPRSVDVAALADGALPDSDAGRAKMGAGFFEQNNALSLAHFDDDFFGQAQVIGSAAGHKFATGAKPLVMNGAPQQDRLFLATLPTNGDWLSIEGTDAVVVPYEFRDSTPPIGGTAGRIWVYRGIDAAAARVNLVDAINAVVDANRIARGAVVDVNGFVARDAVAQTSVLLMEISGSEVTRNVTENLTDGADIWDQATTVGGMLETRQHFGVKQLTINANHLAAGELIFVTGIQPHWALIINHNRPQNEAWAIIAATNAVALTLAGGATPNNQDGDVVTCLFGE